MLLVGGVDPGVEGGIGLWIPSIKKAMVWLTPALPSNTRKRNAAMPFVFSASSLKRPAGDDKKRKYHRPCYDILRFSRILKTIASQRGENDTLIFCIEQQHSQVSGGFKAGKMRSKGRKTTPDTARRSGFGEGLIETCLQLNGYVPLPAPLKETRAVAPGCYYLYVPAATWRTPTVGAKTDKTASLVLARKRFNLKLPLNKHEAAAEALLIADYCYRQWLKPLAGFYSYVESENKCQKKPKKIKKKTPA